jgi:crossover junction endodeoxyribonuclease RuvC
LPEKSKIILGIDPGTVIMGYSLLQVTGSKLHMIQMHSVKLNGRKDMFERLGIIHQTIQDIIKEFRPQELAIEAPFFGKNVQSMLKLGRAQGVAIGVAMYYGLPVTEYSPKKVKQAITGNGNAGKEMVWEMLQRILPVTNKGKYFDASDALAVAVCHHFNQRSAHPSPVQGKRKKGWEDFIRENPHRIT